MENILLSQAINDELGIECSIEIALSQTSFPSSKFLWLLEIDAHNTVESMLISEAVDRDFNSYWLL